MNEHQRMQYLDAMGVETFVPRFVLPHAKASAACILVPINGATEVDRSHEHAQQSDASSIAPSASSDVEVSNETLKSLNDGLSSVLSALELDSPNAQRAPRDTVVPEGKPESNTVAQLESAVDAQSSNSEDQAVEQSDQNPSAQAANFNLALWFTDSQIQVVDARDPADALPTDTLLANILIGNGLLTANLPNQELQRWPIPGARAGDQSWSAASSMMFDFLSYRFESRPAKYFLLFGEASVKAILGADINYNDVLYQTLKADSYGINAIVLPALRDFLYSPESKKELWPALSSLRHL